MRDNILANIKITDIETGVPFTMYCGNDGTQHDGILKDSMDFESEPMEIIITIKYHQKIRTFKNAFTNVAEESKYLMVDTINIKMGMHNRHIDVVLEPELGENNEYQKMYLWGCPCDSSLINLYPLRNVLRICWYVLSEMDFSHIMSFGHLVGGDNVLYKAIIHGIITSKNQELAEGCLKYHCGDDMAFLWNNVNQDSFDENCHADCILIEELVKNNRPELLRMIPLCLRIMLVNHFNAVGKHEIVAALNHYHRGDYKDPGKDLVL